MEIVSYEVTKYNDKAFFEPDLTDRKIRLVERVKTFAPDWDEMSANELLTIMAMNKITFEKDVEAWPRERTETTKRKARR